MNETIKSIILAALDLKEASTKRAAKAANAKFKPIYDSELADIGEARAWLNKQKIAAG